MNSFVRSERAPPETTLVSKAELGSLGGNLEQRAGPVRHGMGPCQARSVWARARMARVPPCRAETGYRAWLRAQARSVGRITGRASPLSTRPGRPSCQPAARKVKKHMIQFQNQFLDSNPISNHTITETDQKTTQDVNITKLIK
jgi:hypothetical protein